MKDMVLPKKDIKQMTKKARSKAKQSLLLSHLIMVHILALIYKADKEGKDRSSCIISTEKLTKFFKNTFPLLKIEEAIKEDLHQLDQVDEIIVLERFNFPQVDFVPTERVFNLMVKIFEELTEGDIIFLEDKLVTIFAVKVVDRATNQHTHEDVKIGDTIPMLRSFFRIRNGKLEWFIPKKSAIKEMKIKHAKKLLGLKQLVKQIEEV